MYVCFSLVKLSSRMQFSLRAPENSCVSLLSPIPFFLFSPKLTLIKPSCPVPSLSLRFQIRSDQISRSVVSNSLRPHESQHARPPCPSPTPGVHPGPRPSSQWCHPAKVKSRGLASALLLFGSPWNCFPLGHFGHLLLLPRTAGPSQCLLLTPSISLLLNVAVSRAQSSHFLATLRLQVISFSLMALNTACILIIPQCYSQVRHFLPLTYIVDIWNLI